MREILVLLTPISLLDSTSIVPICIVFLVALLAGPAPTLKSSALILGIFVTYLACGILILLGMQSVFDHINAYTARLWKYPEPEELVVQIVLGIILLVLGMRMARSCSNRTKEPPKPRMTGVQAFLAGASLTIVGLPGAVPYIAAIDLVLRADLTLPQQMLALLHYNIFFVLPLAAIVAVAQALGRRSQNALARIQRLFDKWGPKIIALLLIILGAVLVADGIGWFLGYPLIPV